ncbi:alpha/beta hydrolase [Oscillochloris sp. ZM17-4]|uniref:alpha/beta fold hydrolase n=1 Tax=Oscillochloris sp. ZM17-4 TaxID=2866714 RepID=UPI001C73BE3B|nr:alpha/beta hydrolase [Oscillochloris sp. ZM17-4]MBX0329276.1 alpha/beta hydrolase [Oscillochloris sp. ZM17-4]
MPSQRTPFLDPLSRTMIPMVNGITRKLMLRFGVAEVERNLAGIPIHLYRLGDGPGLPVVLIHGIADSALTWAFVLRGLARIGPVYAVDLPGFGLSGYPRGRRYATIDEHVDVVRALIAQEIGRPALLVGNSLGGWIAARLALESPELARGIIMLDPGGAGLEGRASWESFVNIVAVPDLRTVRLIFRQMFGGLPLIMALYLGQRSFQTLFLRDPVAQFVAAASEDEFFRPEDLAAIRVPTALIWGQKDHFLPAGCFEFFRDNLPAPAVLTLPGCGHLPQRERPGQVVRFVKKFVEERLS